MNTEGKWIWIPKWCQRKQDTVHLVLFRKKLNFREKKQYRILISADTRYKLYVNDQFVEYGPSRGNDKIWYVDTIDLADYLVIGENVIAVEVLRYPQLSGEGCFGMWRTSFPGLYFVEIDGENNAVWKCHDCCEENQEFKIRKENPVFAPLMLLEERRATRMLQNWRGITYDDSAWETAVVQENGITNLKPRDIPFMRKVKRKFSSVVTVRTGEKQEANWNRLLHGEGMVLIPPNTKTVVEISADVERTAYLHLSMTEGKGSCIRLLTSECYAYEDIESDQDYYMQIPKKGDRTDWKQGKLFGFTDIYYPDGCGTVSCPEVYEPYWWRAFRYIQLEIITEAEPLCIRGFDYTEVGYPLEVKNKPKIMDPVKKKIWEISLRTLECCMQETYMDCPFYEQLQYAMDARSQILYTYVVSMDDRLARKCMNDFMQSQQEDGLLKCCAPNYEKNIIPGFSIYYILMLQDHMHYFGNKSFLENHVECMDRILGYFDTHLDEKGYVKKIGDVNGYVRNWSFIDWTKEWRQTTGVPLAIRQGPITMESMLYIMGLLAGAEIAGFLGKKAVQENYRKRAEQVKAAVNRYCRDKDGFYLDGPASTDLSQHAQVFAVLTDCCSLEEGRQILAETLNHKERFSQCSVAMLYYLFRALEKTGQYERTEELWDIFRRMVEDNLSTCVEDDVEKRSDCHAWGALALYEFGKIDSKEKSISTEIKGE